MDYNTTSSFESFELQVNSVANDFLRGAAKWASILAILGFIGLGILVLMGIMVFAAGSMVDNASSMGSAMPFPMSAIGLLYILMAVVYFFPLLYLYKFSADAKAALNNSNTEKLTDSFKNLKSHFKSIVLIIIIGVVLYIVGIIAFAATIASATGNM
ncbi:hypothetical protein CHU92_02490 [Flavobacterium cyanobacteriorum]|uniref:DUF5362 domain-containing protein n=1 Tax=Flavobacterium cyanobacteriorum TaxID=2022802 RepID=A0A255ZUD4_9FLAO|nr:DUF5362 family protein [Flavobacterium cyanobacteriorum]OYQ44370.1 hypothetical protein CHU92_02490 [Flavobacterium cyanobacteriorum]